MDERPADKGISEPMGAVRRVRDDVFGKRFVGFQEVVPPCPVASVDQVCGHHLVSCRLEHLGNGSVAASGLPNRPVKTLDGQKCLNRLRWRWIKLECSPLRIAAICGRNF